MYTYEDSAKNKSTMMWSFEGTSEYRDIVFSLSYIDSIVQIETLLIIRRLNQKFLVS